MMNRLATIGYFAFIASLGALPSHAGEPGNNSPALDISTAAAKDFAAAAKAPNFDPIGAITPYMAFGGGAMDAPAGPMAMGARIALTDEVDMTFAYGLASSSAHEFVPAHSLILGFSFKF